MGVKVTCRALGGGEGNRRGVLKSDKKKGSLKNIMKRKGGKKPMEQNTGCNKDRNKAKDKTEEVEEEKEEYLT